MAPKSEVKRAVSRKALEALRPKIRQLTRRSGGRSIREVIDGLRSYVLGWKGNFGLAQTPRVLNRLDEWMRDPPQALKAGNDDIPGTAETRGKTERCATGGKEQLTLVAQQPLRLNNVLTIAHFDRLGMPGLT